MVKTFIVLLVSCFAFTSNVSAQASKDTAATFSIADSASFTGKYKYEGMPFEYMQVNVKEGKLYYSGGEYDGFLSPVKDKKDAFDANGEALFTFVRNKENKITDLKIDYQGQSYLGKREEKKN